jgi:hypothetical protein
MNQDPSEDKRLADLVDRALRGLPPRRAPHTLEQRVLAELERRAPHVWWRRSFKDWPVAARAGFVAVSVALSVVTLLGGRWSAAAFDALRDAGTVIALPAHRTLGFLTTAHDLGRLVTRVIPPGWLYDGALIAAALYAGLFGLGTVAYRTLYLKPGQGGIPRS